MEITTKDQIKEGMKLYCARVAPDRSAHIETLVVVSEPYKHHYCDNEFFMWAIDIDRDGKVEQISITDAGIEQNPQYNLHATFTTLTEAIDYKNNVGIDYDRLDDTFEFGGDIYTLDDSVDPNEMVPFTFDDCVVALSEMNLSWVECVEDAREENLADADAYSKELANETESAYDRAMKIV